MNVRRSRSSESGQVIVLTAFLLVPLLAVCAFAIDGGMGFFQSRQAQNAADFAAKAASQLTSCNTSINANVTGAQVQTTVQDLVNDNDSAATTSWTASYLDAQGEPISGASFSSSTTYTPPANACGVSVEVQGTTRTFLAPVIGFNSTTVSQSAAAVGDGEPLSGLAVSSLLPYGRHTIYAGAVGNFEVNGSMFDNSVAQCGDRSTACTAYPNSCGSEGSGVTPLSNITCYGDSADVFQNSTESITGTLFSVAPVAMDACLWPAPSSGTDPVMNQSEYPSQWSNNQCSSDWSAAASPISYGSVQGNILPFSDPLAGLPDPSTNGGTATECPGQSSVQSHGTTTVSSGNLSPGVYTNTVAITGSVTLLPCQSGSLTTGPGIYVFQKGVEICPSANSTVTGSDVMLYGNSIPSNTYSSLNANGTGYCAAADGSSNAVTDAISIGGGSGSSVTLTAPQGGTYNGVALFQSRTTNANIGLDDGWTQPASGSSVPDDATINITGVVYDNSFTNEPSDEVFSSVGSTYAGPYGSLCSGNANATGVDRPTPCPSIPSSTGLSVTYGTITINGAVVVGAFATSGGTTSSPLSLTITFNAAALPQSLQGVHLIS